jgi:hypothetical protein
VGKKNGKKLRGRGGERQRERQREEKWKEGKGVGVGRLAGFKGYQTRYQGRCEQDRRSKITLQP